MRGIGNQLKRHLDILIMLAGGILTAAMLWQSNVDAVADVKADVTELKPKVESIGEVKTDVAVIKQQVSDMKDKVNDMWSIMQRR